MTDIAAKAAVGLAFLLAVLAAALFVPAWSVDYPQAWWYIGVFGCSSALITAALIQHDPALLKRRIHAGPTAERDARQQLMQSLAALSFLSFFVVAAFDHRFAWTASNVVIEIAGELAVIAGFATIGAVFRENTYAAGTIDTFADQHVVDTGPYAVVRHPMYLGALILLTGTPLALGSWWALIPLVPMLAVLVLRLLAEEQYLATHLDGYALYLERVPCRLLPGLW